MKSFKSIIPLLLFAFAANLALAANPASDIPQRKRQSPETVRVVSANIRMPVAADKKTGNDWDKRKEFLCEVLLAQDADIICFQEFHPSYFDHLKKSFPDYHAFGFADTDEGRKVNTVFYSGKRFEKISEGGAFLSPTPDVYRSKFPESSLVRHFVRLHLKDRLTGRELLVWNTHFDHTKLQASRDKQAGVLADFLKKQLAGIHQIVTGDLNCDASTEAIRTIKSAGFTDTHTALHGPADPGHTYHGFKGHNHVTQTGKIDFIFCNNSLRPISAEIIKDHRVIDGVERYPSDHYFISAELEYAKK